MDSRWEALAAAGVPLGAPRAPPRREAVARAIADVRELAAHPEEVDAFHREPLLAWLRAYRQHFPQSFARELGSTGDGLIAALERQPVDENRYLKLRRIAIENLAQAL